ncbi:dimethylarginine dimethylaminohydrolase family protein [Poseidonia sp.]|uniref:dimethylarginine dimethylaminohydrolase family protein n=1 Tax=Poseidonia sp. TaxID=2666344 RepID=UPI003F69C890|nr:arginine deiminase family protein [Candidatus Poseidoniaceae archaeon]MDG1559498.1 arginine deiminase family protein [Candidatus Poseidoniaceae archaeon]
MATVRLDQKGRALTRAIPSSFDQAIAKFFGTGPTDLDQAKAQHLAYREALLNAGVEVTVLPSDDQLPDSIFVEDQAVVIDGHVLLPVPGHPSRVPEQPPIAEFVTRQLSGTQVCRMDGEARMDGGDIIRLGDLFFVGRSSRTNDAGIEELRDLLTHLGHNLRVIEIPGHALHLTSISSTPTDSVILAPEGYLPEDAFGELPEGCEVRWMPKEEAYGCNTIGLPNGQVLVADGYPAVLDAIKSLGLEPVVLDMSQIREADGSLTCCSLFY